ncbi:MAG: D-alanyl-D-alanine carboxypeptidase [Nitrospirae bacterium]|nr:D-alanyl-D-alanine carboxypeptidase [Nitrospirota bacterium]
MRRNAFGFMARAAWLGVALAVLAGAAPAWAVSYTAKTVVTMDALSGQVVESQSGDAPVGPASLAKMMTLYLVYAAVAEGHANWDDPVLAGSNAFHKEGSTMFLREGERVTLRELAYGIGVASGNDACIAVAEFLSGSEDAFVTRMNETAARIGMKHTHFGSATGLPAEGQVTTGEDMARLAYHLIADFPPVIEVLSTQYYTHGGVRQPNRNRLLWKNIGVDGVKTGHTEEDGFHLVASAQKGEQRFIVAVMGADGETSREEIAERYLLAAFRRFATVRAIKPGEPVAQVVVWKGAADSVGAVPDGPVFVSVPREREAEVTVAATVAELEAPVAKGQVVGTAQVYVGTEVVREVSLVADREVPEGGFFTRIWDALVLMFRALLDKLF